MGSEAHQDASGHGQAAAEPASRRLLLPDRLLDRLLLGAVAVCIVGLAADRVWVDSHALEAVLWIGLVAAFIELTLVNIRLALAVALFELALAGASGHWARAPGGLTGRIFLDVVVTVWAVVLLVLDARRTGRWPGWRSWEAHALALAVLFPLVWMTLGIARGNRLSDVVGDGNGLVFFAFAVVVLLMIRRGDGGWLRSLFFAACVANALFTLALFLVSVTGLVSLDELHRVLVDKLLVGNVVGRMPNGAYRLYLASGLYLQAGLALTAWRLLQNPRRLLYWLLFAILWIDIVATYTRGLWLGALLAVGLVFAVGTAHRRRLVEVTAGCLALAGIAAGIGAAGGFSLPHYVWQRTSSIVTTSAAPGNVELRDADFEIGGIWGLHRVGSVVETASTYAKVGGRSLALANPAADTDAYVFQTARMTPNTVYTASAWVDASGLTAPATLDRGLVAWDQQNGPLYTARLDRRRAGWRRLSVTFVSGPDPGGVEVRLYAPQGSVYWDDITLVQGPTLTEREGIAPYHSLPRTTAARLADPGFETAGSAWTLRKRIPGPVTARRIAYARTGQHGLELVNRRAVQDDDFVQQRLALRPRRIYTVGAWVDAGGLQTPKDRLPTRGLVAWDADNGAIYRAPLTEPVKGWQHLSLSFVSGSSPGVLELRLYAPQGRVVWDDVSLSETTATRPQNVVPPATSAATHGDTAGQTSNGIRVEQARVLLRHIRQRPLLGSGFGSIARDYRYGTSYSYELAYLDLLFKTGVIGLLLFLSFPLRLLWAAVQGRRRRRPLPVGVPRRETSVVIAIVVSVLFVGGTNPSFLAAFGLAPILLCLAWLVPGPDDGAP